MSIQFQRVKFVFFRQVAVTVELEGTHTRGMMVLDYMDLLKKKHKAFVMKKVDLEKFKQMFMNSLKKEMASLPPLVVKAKRLWRL